MSRVTFLTILACISTAVGLFALSAPSVLLSEVKHADANGSAVVMARTVGILILSNGVLNFLVRKHPDSPTMRSVLLANLFLQIGIIPIDPFAYLNGVYSGLDSFVPNTILHCLLIWGLVHQLRAMSRRGA